MSSESGAILFFGFVVNAGRTSMPWETSPWGGCLVSWCDSLVTPISPIFLDDDDLLAFGTHVIEGDRGASPIDIPAISFTDIGRLRRFAADALGMKHRPVLGWRLVSTLPRWQSMTEIATPI